MDEPIKQLIIVAVAVIAGLALISFVKSDGSIMLAVSKGITDFIGEITANLTPAG